MYVYIYIDHGCGLGSVRHLRVSSRRQHSALSPLAPPEKPTRNRLLHPECVRRRLASTASLSTDTPSMLSSPQGRRGASRSGPDFARGLFPGRKERRPAPSFTGLFVPCAVGSFLPFWASVLLPPDTCPLGPRSLRLSLLFLRVIISPLLGNTPPKNTDDPFPPRHCSCTCPRGPVPFRRVSSSPSCVPSKKRTSAFAAPVDALALCPARRDARLGTPVRQLAAVRSVGPRVSSTSTGDGSRPVGRLLARAHERSTRPGAAMFAGTGPSFGGATDRPTWHGRVSAPRTTAERDQPPKLAAPRNRRGPTHGLASTNAGEYM